MEVLADMDVKGTGEIEFDEFIYFMTRPQVSCLCPSEESGLKVKNYKFVQKW